MVKKSILNLLTDGEDDDLPDQEQEQETDLSIQQETDNEDNLPVVFKPLHELITYPLEAFTPVAEDADDKETTISDLQQLNNHLAYCTGVLPHLRTPDALFKCSHTVIKLIEARRKVKKLSYGKEANSRGVFEVLE